MLKLSIVFTAIVILFWTALSLPAQTAKVIALSPSDAAEAKSLYEQKAAIEKKIEMLRKRVTRTYLVADSSDKDRRQMVVDNGESFILKSGWSSNFLYSEDFRFIVPNASPSNRTIACGLGDCSNWIITTPAIGTTSYPIAH